MIITLHGDDSFTSHEKLTVLMERFSASYGAHNITVLSGDSVHAAETVVQAYSAMPLLGSKRMVVVKNFFMSKPPTELCETLSERIARIPDHAVLIIYEPIRIADTANPFLKALIKNGRTEECKPPTPPQMVRWITQRITMAGKSIEPAAAEFLTECVGTDRWSGHHAVEQLLSLTADDTTVTLAHVERLFAATPSTTIFALIDAIGNRNLRVAVRELHALRSLGEPALYLLSMIAYQLRNVALAREAIDAKTPPATFARTCSLKPFVAQKSLSAARKFSMGEIRMLYDDLVRSDRAIKQGALDPEHAVSAMVVRFCLSGVPPYAG